MYWDSFKPGADSSARELAELRRAVGSEPGAVAALWRFYRTPVPDSYAARGIVPPRLAAEHAALGLFALHQQSKHGKCMHDPDVPLGQALRALRGSGRYSAEAVDRRVNAAATATSVSELVAHLRGLVTQLRAQGLAFDYGRLVADLAGWERPESRGRTRRAWGMQYYRWETPTDVNEPTAERVSAGGELEGTHG